MSQTPNGIPFRKVFSNRVPVTDINDLRQEAQSNGLTPAELDRFLRRHGLDQMARGELVPPQPPSDEAA